MEISQKSRETEGLKGKKLDNEISILKWLQREITENVRDKTSDIFSHADCEFLKSRDILLHYPMEAPSLEETAHDHQTAEHAQRQWAAKWMLPNFTISFWAENCTTKEVTVHFSPSV